MRRPQHRSHDPPHTAATPVSSLAFLPIPPLLHLFPLVCILLRRESYFSIVIGNQKSPTHILLTQTCFILQSFKRTRCCADRSELPEAILAFCLEIEQHQQGRIQGRSESD
jgi:hypothetical protein